MANNRAWLRCDVCSDEILLVKYYGSTGWYIHHDEEKLNAFLEDHSYCGGASDVAMCGNRRLSLRYETPEAEPPPRAS